MSTVTPDPAAPVGLDLDALRERLAMTDMVSPLPWRVNTGEEVIDADGRLVSIDGRQQGYNPHFVVAAVNATKDLAALLGLVSRQATALRHYRQVYPFVHTHATPEMRLACFGCEVDALVDGRSLLPREPQT